jgi:hypothetical protein
MDLKGTSRFKPCTPAHKPEGKGPEIRVNGLKRRSLCHRVCATKSGECCFPQLHWLTPVRLGRPRRRNWKSHHHGTFTWTKYRVVMFPQSVNGLKRRDLCHRFCAKPGFTHDSSEFPSRIEFDRSVPRSGDTESQLPVRSVMDLKGPSRFKLAPRPTSLKGRVQGFGERKLAQA